jgi:DNA-directed RNA polymerase subunit H
MDEERHTLVPLHEKLNDKEKEQLLEEYNITVKELPKILMTDAALAGMDVKPGDVIKITRTSPTAGTTYFYRGVMSE